MAKKIKKGDEVEVMRGQSRGKKGKVLRVLREEDRVVVEGLNMVKRHCKPSAKMKQGGIVDQEAPIHISNVKRITAVTP
jgi:large subunit ribosomal protein L24